MATAVGGIRLDTKKLDAMAASLDTTADRVLERIARQVEGIAKTKAPVDTGALRNSLHVEKTGRLLYWVADGVEYGVYQELGTYKMAAQPFLVPACENVQRELETQFAELFK